MYIFVDFKLYLITIVSQYYISFYGKFVNNFLRLNKVTSCAHNKRVSGYV